MAEQGWGRIINVSGLAARHTGSVVGSVRNVAVAALTKNLADELGPAGINVTVVHPGPTVTEREPPAAAVEEVSIGRARHRRRGRRRDRVPRQPAQRRDQRRRDRGRRRHARRDSLLGHGLPSHRRRPAGRPHARPRRSQPVRPRASSSRSSPTVDALAAAPPRALLVQASGRVVSAGVDVHEFEGLAPRDAAVLWRRLIRAVQALEDLPCPTVFAAHGLCLTAAFEIALACDLLLAATSARFGLVETVVGLTPSMGGPQRLTERAGPGAGAPARLHRRAVRRARRSSTGASSPRSCPTTRSPTTARASARKLAHGPTRAHAATKRLVRTAADHGVRAADALVPDVSAPLFDTEDLRGAVASFLEGRPGQGDLRRPLVGLARRVGDEHGDVGVVQDVAGDAAHQRADAADAAGAEDDRVVVALLGRLDDLAARPCRAGRSCGRRCRPGSGRRVASRRLRASVSIVALVDAAGDRHRPRRRARSRGRGRR